MEIIQAVIDENSSKIAQKDFLLNFRDVMLKTHLELTVVLFMLCLARMAYDPGLTTAVVALS